MNPSVYSMLVSVHTIPTQLLDLRPDNEIDITLLKPPPISSERNIFFLWHSGFTKMHPYTLRNIRAYHRRLSKLGWTICILDRIPNSHLNISQYIDITDPDTIPTAFINGTIAGAYAAQHASELVRWHLLVKYDGVYADVRLLLIGDLAQLSKQTLENPHSRFEALSYDFKDGN